MQNERESYQLMETDSRETMWRLNLFMKHESKRCKLSLYQAAEGVILVLHFDCLSFITDLINFLSKFYLLDSPKLYPTSRPEVSKFCNTNLAMAPCFVITYLGSKVLTAFQVRKSVVSSLTRSKRCCTSEEPP